MKRSIYNNLRQQQLKLFSQVQTEDPTMDRKGEKDQPQIEESF